MRNALRFILYIAWLSTVMTIIIPVIYNGITGCNYVDDSGNYLLKIAL